MCVVITFGYSKEKKGQTSFVYPETNKPLPPKVHFLPPVFKTKMCLKVEVCLANKLDFFGNKILTTNMYQYDR